MSDELITQQAAPERPVIGWSVITAVDAKMMRHTEDTISKHVTTLTPIILLTLGFHRFLPASESAGTSNSTEWGLGRRQSSVGVGCGLRSCKFESFGGLQHLETYFSLGNREDCDEFASLPREDETMGGAPSSRKLKRFWILVVMLAVDFWARPKWMGW